MDPLPESDGHGAPRLIKELVPSVAAVLSVQSQLVSVWRDLGRKRHPSGGKRLPLGQGSRAAKLVCLVVDEMTLLIEMVMQAGMNGCEFLERFHLPKT